VVSRGRPDLGEATAEVLDEPVLAVSATGTIVVPPPAS
jgi:3-aminobutyryl-CoA ammonia-lyase